MSRPVGWIILGCAIGCGGGDGWTGTVLDSAGLTVVHNGEQGSWHPGDQWTVREVLRIGTAEGEPDYQFGAIVGITEGAGGRIYVLDQHDHQIKVYRSDGSFDFRFGGGGSGPGELGPGAAPILHGPGDTLLIPDLQQRRVNRYLEDGTSIGSFPLGIESGIPIRWQETSSGAVVGQFRPLSLPDRPAPDSMDFILALQPDGTIADTILTFASGRTFSITRSGFELKIFSTEPLWAMGDSALAFGVSDDYRIELHDQARGLVGLFTRPFTLQPVTETDRSVIIAAIEKAWRSAGLPPAAVAQMRNNVSFGEQFPAFQQMLAGPEGTIWVQRIRRPSDLPPELLEDPDFQRLSGSTEWELFNRGGRYLGVTTLPERFTPMRVRGESILGVWLDELDVPYVLKLEVVTG